MRATIRVAAAVFAAVLVTACTSAVATDPVNNGNNNNQNPTASVLSVTPTSVTGTVGQSASLSASVLDNSGHQMTGQSITWTSSAPGTASVSSSGAVTLLAVGSARVTAAADGLTTDVPVTVSAAGPAPVASVSVSPSSASLNPGGTVSLTASAVDSTGHAVTTATFSWSSSNSSVATVSTSGVVTAIAVGSAMITASAQGKSASANIAVVASSPAAVASVTLSPNPASVYIARTVQLTATLKDSNGNVLGGRTVTWSSSNTGDATVSAAGLVSGVAAGTVTITATSGSVNGTVSVAVSAVPVASVTVTPGSSSLQKGQTLQLSATDKDANGTVITGQSVTWSSSNSGVATVSSSGLVTSIAVGSATITATSGGQSGTSSITVTPLPVALVTVSPGSATIVKGATSQLSATAKDQTGTVISGQSFSWSSSNTGVATVSSSGLVTGVAAGGATITASDGGKSGTATITVTNPAVASVTVSPSTASVAAGATQQLTATPKDANGTAITGQTMVWTSSNTGAATVSSAGLVTGVAAGSATITASTGGKAGTSTITVTASSGYVSECASPKSGWVWCDDFDTDRTSSYFEYDNAGGNFVRTAGVGVGGSTGMLAHYINNGTSSFGSLKLGIGKVPSSTFRPVDAGTAIYRELYWRIYIKYQAGWIGGGGDKMMRAISLVDANWSEAAFAHVWSGADGTSAQNQLFIDPASGTDSAGNVITSGYNDFAHMRWLGATGSTLTMFDAAHVGQWYCVEAHAKLNDPGSSNGVMQLYINGTLQAQDTGMNWVGSYQTYGFNAVFVENFWNQGSPATQDRYIDNFVVSTQPIGCGPTP